MMDVYKEMKGFVDEMIEVEKENMNKDVFILPKVYGAVGDKIIRTTIKADNNPRYLVKKYIEEMRKMNADWIVTVIEARMKSYRNDKEQEEFLKNYKYGDLQKDKYAEDCIVVVGTTRDGKQYCRICKVVQLEEGYEFDDVDIEDGELKGFLVPDPW